MDIIINIMRKEDWKQVSEIYLAGIHTEIATFQREIPTWEEWDSGHCRVCRYVARRGDKIIGWIALSPVSTRSVYAGVAEVSIYIVDGYKGRGIGTDLLEYLIPHSEKEGYWTLQSGIIKENIPSRRLHEKCGFREVGYRERIGKMMN